MNPLHTTLCQFWSPLLVCMHVYKAPILNWLYSCLAHVHWHTGVFSFGQITMIYHKIKDFVTITHVESFFQVILLSQITFKLCKEGTTLWGKKTQNWRYYFNISVNIAFIIYHQYFLSPSSVHNLLPTSKQFNHNVTTLILLQYLTYQ